MAAYVGLSQQINFARLPSPGDRFDLRDLIGEGMALENAFVFSSSSHSVYLGKIELVSELIRYLHGKIFM